MHAEKSISKAHKVARNRLGLLRSFIDDHWDTEGAYLATIERLEAVKMGSRGEVGALQSEARHQSYVCGGIEVGSSISSQVEYGIEDRINAIRERMGTIEIVIGVLDDEGVECVTDALSQIYRRKLRIEKYAEWLHSEHGRQVLR